MNRIARTLTVAIVAVAALCACSENRGDPIVAGVEELEFGGMLYPHTDGANAAVTGQNEFGLCQAVFWDLYDSYLRANRQALQYLEQSSVRFLANYTGNAVVSSISTSTSTNGEIVGFDATVTYNDYSSNGKLFMGGTITFQGVWGKIGIHMLPVSLRLDGGVVFAGDYKGSIQFINFKLGIDSEGALIIPGTRNSGFPAEGDVVIESSGATLSVNPYPSGP